MSLSLKADLATCTDAHDGCGSVAHGRVSEHSHSLPFFVGAVRQKSRPTIFVRPPRLCGPCQHTRRRADAMFQRRLRSNATRCAALALYVSSMRHLTGIPRTAESREMIGEQGPGSLEGVSAKASRAPSRARQCYGRLRGGGSSAAARRRGSSPSASRRWRACWQPTPDMGSHSGSSRASPLRRRGEGGCYAMLCYAML